MSSEPGKDLLRRISGHQNVGRTSQRDPLADERLERSGLRTAVWPFSAPAGILGALDCGTCTGRDKAESPEDAPRLMRRKVGPIEPGDTTEHLLRWEASPTHDDVMLSDGIWELPHQLTLDGTMFELELLSSNCERGHILNCIL
jgi:hypothetical protein